MNIRLHKNATTTPARRAEIQSSTLSVAALAAQHGVSEDTIRRWIKRDTVFDRSHTPHRLRTTLTSAQEALVVELRKTLWLPLDDLLAVTREFIHPAASRSALERLGHALATSTGGAGCAGGPVGLAQLPRVFRPIRLFRDLCHC